MKSCCYHPANHVCCWNIFRMQRWYNSRDIVPLRYLHTRDECRRLEVNSSSKNKSFMNKEVMTIKTVNIEFNTVIDIVHSTKTRIADIIQSDSVSWVGINMRKHEYHYTIPCDQIFLLNQAFVFGRFDHEFSSWWVTVRQDSGKWA